MLFSIYKIGYSIFRFNQLIKTVIQSVYFRSITVTGDKVKFLIGAQIHNIYGARESIKIGSNTTILGQLLTFKHGGSIEIGEWCYVGEGTRVWSAEMIKIGDRVLVSHGVNIHDTNSHPIDPKLRHQHFVEISKKGHPKNIDNIASSAVIIEDDAWIGCNSIIMKGVVIGRSSIVAAGSVVTKNVPPNSIVAGNPACMIRKI